MERKVSERRIGEDGLNPLAAIYPDVAHEGTKGCTDPICLATPMTEHLSGENVISSLILTGAASKGTMRSEVYGA